MKFWEPKIASVPCFIFQYFIEGELMGIATNFILNAVFLYMLYNFIYTL